MGQTNGEETRDVPAGRILVTAPAVEAIPDTISIIEGVAPGAAVRRTDFRAVLMVELEEGDAVETARLLLAEHGEAVGHVTPVLAECESRLETISEAAAQVAVGQVREGESFSFRLNKRGSHWLRAETPELEREIGGAIHEALEGEHGASVRVDLTDPDIVVRAEVLGPITVIGVMRPGWSGGV